MEGQSMKIPTMALASSKTVLSEYGITSMHIFAANIVGLAAAAKASQPSLGHIRQSTSVWFLNFKQDSDRTVREHSCSVCSANFNCIVLLIYNKKSTGFVLKEFVEQIVTYPPSLQDLLHYYHL